MAVALLSRRQSQIADGIRRGLSYAEIGAELGCEAPTVRTHVVRMAAKLGRLVLERDELLGPREIVSRWTQRRKRGKE